MIKLLQAPITSMTLGGLSFLLTMFFLLQRPVAVKAVSHVEPDESGPAAFWARHNP